MRSDDDVHAAGLGIGDDRLLLLRINEAAEHSDIDGKGCEALFEGFEVLVAQDCRRGEHRDLFAVCNRFERGPHRHFRLSVTDIAADQPVHGNRVFHVAFDIRDGCQLIRRFVVLKGFLEFLLPLGVRRKRVAIRQLAMRVKLQQFLGHIADGALDPGLSLDPRRAAQFVELRLRTFGRGIFLDKVEPLEWHVKTVSALIHERHAFLVVNQRDAVVRADPVIDVDDIIVWLQILQIRNER